MTSLIVLFLYSDQYCCVTYIHTLTAGRNMFLGLPIDTTQHIYSNDKVDNIVTRALHSSLLIVGNADQALHEHWHMRLVH